MNQQEKNYVALLEQMNKSYKEEIADKNAIIDEQKLMIEELEHYGEELRKLLEEIIGSAKEQ